MNAMQTANAWSRYWATGQSHSCFTQGKPFDTSRIWAEVFEGAKPGARVLDLAAGGGALTHLAVGHPSKFQVTGVDYAQSLPPIDGADMRPGIRLEALPFADGAFDLVISQFGIEYADPVLAHEEATRVLADGGQVAFLIHHDQGEVAKASAGAAARAERLVGAEGPVQSVIALGQAAAERRATQAHVEKVARALSLAQSGEVDSTVGWALGFVQELMAKRALFPPQYLIENGKTLLGELDAFVIRARAMAGAAQSAGQIDDLKQRYEAAGLADFQSQIVPDKGQSPVAWLVTAHR
jgi:ubiquinone/menaquinone biosynthesis C-methylase UbiE